MSENTVYGDLFVRGHLIRKLDLERMLLVDPDDPALLRDYFDLLGECSRSAFGLLNANLPGFQSPIFFRANTSDYWNMRQIFFGKEFDFPFPAHPRRILDLGAYCGYAALYLSSRFPGADIFCVEPSADTFRILELNTGPYDNIRRINAAVWNQSGRLAFSRSIGGHWGNVFRKVEENDRAEVRACTVPELLREAGWASADFVKCDIEGAEVEVFSDPNREAWICDTVVISVETHDRFKPGCEEAVARALDSGRFERSVSGELAVFQNRQPTASRSWPEVPGPMLLMGSFLPLRGLQLGNVPAAAWGFAIIDTETIQLHPNNPGEPASEVTLSLELWGQREFRVLCRLDGGGENSVIFSVRVRKGTQEIAKEALEVKPGKSQELLADLNAIHGSCLLTLSTEMARGSTGNGRAWARWIGPSVR